MKALLFLFPLSALAAPCPDLQGTFEAKVGDVLNRIEVKQTNCEAFELRTVNSEGQEIRRKFVTDSVTRTLQDTGRKIETAAARMAKIRVGNNELVALRVDLTETDRYLETTVHEKIHFYTEGSGEFRGLVERKDVSGADGESLGRIYIGYASANRP
ncbi:MAG: hypothetical protein HUU37_06700 [Bdellovibrionales bacterium]|nr:hypothetical protein [Bdellovibrionales bacterium]